MSRDKSQKNLSACHPVLRRQFVQWCSLWDDNLYSEFHYDFPLVRPVSSPSPTQTKQFFRRSMTIWWRGLRFRWRERHHWWNYGASGQRSCFASRCTCGRVRFWPTSATIDSWNESNAWVVRSVSAPFVTQHIMCVMWPMSHIRHHRYHIIRHM